MWKAAFRVGENLAFKDTTWRFGQNEQWAIVGGNGSGKSLFLEAVRGTLPVVRGELSYHFRPPAGLSHAEAISQVCFEDRKLDVHHMVLQSRWNSLEEDDAMHVRDFLSYERVMDVNPFEVTNRHESARAAFARRQARATRQLKIDPLLDRLVISLSHGERQKLQIARALSRPLRLLLLDEPFAGLDTPSRDSFRETLEHLMASGLHVLIATTRPEDLPATITHSLEIDNLRVVAQRRHRYKESGNGARGNVGLGRMLKVLSTNKSGALVPVRKAPQDAAYRKPLLAKATNNAKRLKHTRSDSSSRALARLGNVTVKYGQTEVLKGVSWIIREGERWAMVGRNGSGKSTLLGLITGDHPQAYVNDIEVFGKRRGEGDSVWETKKHIGLVSPELHLHFEGDWTCAEVVASGFYDSVGLYERPTARQRAQAQKWLRRLQLRCGCEPFCTRSLGEQRMVLIARAMVKEPRLLILDEPCQGMDLKHRRLVMRTVDGIAEQHRATIIYVTHRKDEIPRSIDRVFELA